MEYKACKPGVSNEQAAKYGPELERLKSLHGKHRPDRIVESAEDKESPLHDYFEWDNQKAGYKYRIGQARQLAGSIRVIMPEEKNSKPSPVQLVSEKIKPVAGTTARLTPENIRRNTNKPTKEQQFLEQVKQARDILSGALFVCPTKLKTALQMSVEACDRVLKTSDAGNKIDGILEYGFERQYDGTYTNGNYRLCTYLGKYKLSYGSTLILEHGDFGQIVEKYERTCRVS